ncbi:ephexin-1 [Anguilla anguilla]|uniref:ephexin-1 n=1 Tax=Anguilla anguilla TaxID=7936 RepID=UPI0015AF0279|nr:ephexin-1 [Anguilla anguilla]XP_035242525.1 ephexin-1 [Anguilla anguilla]
MAFTALFKGLLGQRTQDNQPTIVPSDQDDDDMDDDHDVRRNTPIRRNSRFYRSMRRTRQEQLSSNDQPNQSPSPRRFRDATVNKRTGPSPAPSVPAHPVNNRTAMPPRTYESRTALPSNGESKSLHAPQNGATSPSASKLKGGSGGLGLSPSDGQHGPLSQGEHSSRTLRCSTDMDSLTENVSSWSVLTPNAGMLAEPTDSRAVADLDGINLRLNNRESSQKPERKKERGEPMSHSIKIIKNIEFLYQEYRDTSKQQEIQQRRQQDGMQVGFGGGAGGGGTAPPTLQLQLRNRAQSLSLWQNLEVVRQSGLLDTLPLREIIMQEAMFELVTSEASYYKSLEVLETHFLKNPVLVNTLSQSDMHFLFSNIEDVMKASERFLMDLENRVEQSIQISDVCDIVHCHALSHFHVFITYVINQAYQEKNYRRILQENTSFRETMFQLENHPRVRGLSFTSFLILPFQRITRLKLLVQNILKNAEENSEREANAIKAHFQLEKIVKECNEGVRKMSRTEELISIEKTLEFKSKSVPVISHSRWLLKKGELQHMSGPKSTRTIRSRKLYQPVYLFLFNNLLLVTKRSSSGEKFQVLDSCARSMLRTEDLEDHGQMLANVFILKLLENQDDRPVTYMLKTSSMSDKLRWICALTPNRRTRFASTSAHQPDCPQVQCVQSYSSQEPDELSIEMADILNVLEKTDDGWMMGERLHDEEKGWFPCRVVEEIKNEELRAQYLRECQRIHQAQGGGPGAIMAGSRGRRTAKVTNRPQMSQMEQDY